MSEIIQVKARLTFGGGNPRTGLLAPNIGNAGENDVFGPSLLVVGGGP